MKCFEMPNASYTNRWATYKESQHEKKQRAIFCLPYERK